MEREPAAEYVITPHAALEIARRGLSEETVRSVLASPEQRHDVRPGRLVFQSRLRFGSPQKVYLVRVVVDVDRTPPEIVTAYRTSKIEKYWRPEP